ncbi:MAG: glutamate--tRNA ligase [Candidatus Micrarchaeota archaeon]|nr:glutamate--tRNA ligase [Candidatus Micrarchaeota archaeon]
MALNKSAKEKILKFALKNAMDYGKAVEGAVISKAIASDPLLKSDMKELVIEVKKTISEVNAMNRKKLDDAFSKYSDEFEKREMDKAIESAKHRFQIDGVEQGKFVTRFPPEPGGYMHIGHTKPVFIEDELKRLYDGKAMLYFDDTNPDNERQEFVDAFHEDLEWLGVKFEGEYYASDNLPKFYAYADTAIRKKKAYVCTCDAETVNSNRGKGMGCAHKRHSVEKNLELWGEMLEGRTDVNGAILRLNSDMKALNTTLRDPTLFRIKKTEHYRQGMKYSAWPTYDFCTPIMDSTNGVTDVLRSKEYEMRDELYFAVLDILELRKPRITSFSRLEISGNVTSKRKVRQMIADNVISGWDDPRLVTIRALRRRGIMPEAIRQFALSFGMGKSESSVPLEMLLSINRKMADKDAKRLFFVIEPFEIEISGIPESLRHVRMDFHPSGSMGHREYDIEDIVYIAKEDAKQLKKGDIIRLKGAFNLRIDGRKAGKTLATFTEEKGEGMPTVQWVSKGNYSEGSLLMINDLLVGDKLNKNSMYVVNGYVETHAGRFKEGDIVQFERIGMFKFDSRKDMSFISL